MIRVDDVMIKKGHQVRPNEEAALHLVKQHTNVPVPTVHASSYEDGIGCIHMTWIDSEPLDVVWEDIEDDKLKERICCHTWELIYQFRSVNKPPEFQDFFQCGADGRASHDVLLSPLPDHDANPLRSDQDVRDRIYERYLHYHGRRYEKEMPDMLPRSDTAVFTHADTAPRNIIVQDDYEYPVMALVDWETAGWYPDYWEYANIMSPAAIHGDWAQWMEYTAPEKWDISGITASRRVLF